MRQVEVVLVLSRDKIHRTEHLSKLIKSNNEAGIPTRAEFSNIDAAEEFVTAAKISDAFWNGCTVYNSAVSNTNAPEYAICVDGIDDILYPTWSTKDYLNELSASMQRYLNIVNAPHCKHLRIYFFVKWIGVDSYSYKHFLAATYLPISTVMLLHGNNVSESFTSVNHLLDPNIVYKLPLPAAGTPALDKLYDFLFDTVNAGWAGKFGHYAYSEHTHQVASKQDGHIYLWRPNQSYWMITADSSMFKSTSLNYEIKLLEVPA